MRDGGGGGGYWRIRPLPVRGHSYDEASNKTRDAAEKVAKANGGK